jgi:lysophospholipase L1-like esterase
MALHDTPYYRRYDTTNGKLSQALFEVAEENDIRFMDAAAWEIPMAYDNVHFSELGHEVFAEIVAQQLFEPWLAEMRQAGE